MDVGTATDTGGWKLGGGSVVIDALFDFAPIVLWGLCVSSLVCNALLACSILSSFAIILTKKR